MQVSVWCVQIVLLFRGFSFYELSQKITRKTTLNEIALVIFALIQQVSAYETCNSSIGPERYFGEGEATIQSQILDWLSPLCCKVMLQRRRFFLASSMRALFPKFQRNMGQAFGSESPVGWSAATAPHSLAGCCACVLSYEPAKQIFPS